MSLWGIRTTEGDGVVTWGGNALVHPNLAEMEFLFPGRQFVDLSNSVLPKTMIRDHPDMAAIRWPLRKEDFR